MEKIFPTGRRCPYKQPLKTSSSAIPTKGATKTIPLNPAGISVISKLFRVNIPSKMPSKRAGRQKRRTFRFILLIPKASPTDIRLIENPITAAVPISPPIAGKSRGNGWWMNPANSNIPTTESEASLIRWGCCLILDEMVWVVPGTGLLFSSEYIPE